MNSTDKVWLVKCKGHILGPFDSMSVEKMVKEGEISIEDSLCIPHKIWRKVSDYQNFQKVVKEIKGRRNEDYTPKTSFDDSQTQTIDQDLRREDTVTQEINPKNINANRASEIVLENVVEEPIKRKKIPNTKPNTNRSYGYQATQVGQKEASEFKKVIWRSSIILLIIFLGAYVYKTIYIDPEDNKMLIVKYRAEAVSKGRSGQYTEALKLYEKILEVDPKDFEAMLRLGIYYIQVDDQVFKGQELLRKVIANGGPFPKYAYVGIGLGYHAEKELSEAENYYLKSLELDGRFAPALVNLGSIELERGNYKKARDYFKDNLDSGEDDLGVNILYAMSFLLDPSMKNSPDLTSLQSDLNFLGQLDGDYSQEAKFLSMYIDFMQQKLRVALKKLPLLMDTLPDLTERHRKGLFINRRMISWSRLYDWCMDLTRNLGRTPRVSALKSLCHYKIGNMKQAKMEIEKAIIQAPKDPLLQSYYAALLRGEGLGIEASVSLGKAISNNLTQEYTLPYIIQALFCQEKEDFQCAESNWLKVIPSGRNIPIAATGLAVSNFHSNNMIKTKTYLKQAEAKSKNYLPLLQLVSDLKRN